MTFQWAPRGIPCMFYILSLYRLFHNHWMLWMCVIKPTVGGVSCSGNARSCVPNTLWNSLPFVVADISTTSPGGIRTKSRSRRVIQLARPRKKNTGKIIVLLFNPRVRKLLQQFFMLGLSFFSVFSHFECFWVFHLLEFVKRMILLFLWCLGITSFDYCWYRFMIPFFLFITSVTNKNEDHTFFYTCVLADT